MIDALKTRLLTGLLAAAWLAPALSPALAGTVELQPMKDNTVYQSPGGTVSNGAGQHTFAGTTNSGGIRRTVISFNVARSVPRGVTITDVRLRMHMSKSIVGERQVAAHRVLADWGEGDSDAPGEEGGGGGAMPGDVTWVHAFFDSVFWPLDQNNIPIFGGVYAPEASATTMVGDVGFYEWGSTPNMLDDVEQWITDPAGNFGWMLIGEEATNGSSKRFDSRENPDEALRPVLIVEYESKQGEAPACAVACPGPNECEGSTTTVVLEGSAVGSGPLAYAWNGPCLVADPSAAITTAECSGSGEFFFTFTAALDENENGSVDRGEPASDCSYEAYVQDTVAPKLEAPADLELECEGAASASAKLVAAATDSCSGVSVVNSRSGASPDASGSFGMGLNTVMWAAVDFAGNSDAASTDVIVADTTPPKATCSASFAATAEAAYGGGGNDEDEDGDDEGSDGPPGPGGGSGELLEIHVGASDACCMIATEAVIDLGCMQVAVGDGDLIRLTCLDANTAAGTGKGKGKGKGKPVAGCGADVDADGTLALRSATAQLIVEASDCAAHTGICVQDLCGVASSASSADDDPPDVGVASPAGISLEQRPSGEAPPRRPSLRRGAR